MSTIQKIRLDADRFATLYGLDNPITAKLYYIVEILEGRLGEEEFSQIFEDAWKKIYADCEDKVRNPV